MGEIFQWVRPAEQLPFTGERFTSDISGQIEIEHLHRYFFARALSRGRDVLDVASGEGYGSALVAQTAKSVVGVELDAATVAHANRVYSGSNLAFVRGDARAIPLKSGSVDVVLSFETIEHLYEQEEFVAEVRRVLRPDGVFIVSTPDRDVYSPADSPANPYHVRELTVAEFKQTLGEHFGHIHCWLQRPMVGSVLLPEQSNDSDAPPLTFERRGDDHFEASNGLPRALYAIAVASARQIPRAPVSVYIESAQLAGPRQEMEALSAQLAIARSHSERLEGVFAVARSENERLEGLFKSACDENQRLEGLFKSACEENQRLERLFATACSENQRLESFCQETVAEVKKLTSHLADGDVGKQALEGEHRRLAEELAQMQATLTHTTAERDAALQKAAEVSLRLEQIEASTSWRALASIRGFCRRLRQR